MEVEAIDARTYHPAKAPVAQPATAQPSVEIKPLQTAEKVEPVSVASAATANPSVADNVCLCKWVRLNQSKMLTDFPRKF